MAPQKMGGDELAETFCRSSIAFVGRSSFERRCIHAFEKLSQCSVIYRHFFVSLNESEIAREIRASLRLSDEEESILDTTNPLQTREVILRTIKKISDLNEPNFFVVDVTSFRREELLILLKAIFHLPGVVWRKFRFVYSVATSMGSWLSSSVREIRPVIGYPGEVFSRQPTHLIILVGIEHHRARAIIEKYEPSQISLGMVPRSESVSLEIYERNLELHDYIRTRFDAVTVEFTFPARNPRSVVLELERLVIGRENMNTVIAPLNTKLSTLACGVFALTRPSIQLCYAEVDLYNIHDYSSIDEEVLVFGSEDLHMRA